MDFLRSVLALAAALALAGQLVSAKSHVEYGFCRDLNSKILPKADRWRDATVAYESAMAEMGVMAKLSIGWRKHLADGWRAATFDEPCGPKSFAYVSAIYACRPGAHPTQEFLERDVRKYAQKCLTTEYLEEKFQKHVRGLFVADPTRIESFLTSDLLANYRRSNPDEPKLHFGKHVRDNCCEPLDIQQVLAASLDEKFPGTTAKFVAKREKGFEMMRMFLETHLYKPCSVYVRHVGRFMRGVEAAARYTLNDDLGQLSQGFQDAIFRYKFCRNMKNHDELFNELMFKAIQGQIAQSS